MPRQPRRMHSRPGARPCSSARPSSQRFPRIREVCLDVITKDGQDYAVVKGDLLRVSSKTARIRPQLPDGTKAEARDIAIDPKRKVMVDGEAVAPKDIAVGQEVTFYVKVSEPVAALEPADTAPLAPMPLAEEAAPRRAGARHAEDGGPTAADRPGWRRAAGPRRRSRVRPTSAAVRGPRRGGRPATATSARNWG